MGKKPTETTKTFNGSTVSHHTRNKYREFKVWDVRQYNFLEKKWEREGERRTHKQAYNRYYWLSRQHPYGKFEVCLIPGRVPTNAKPNQPVETSA